MHGGHLSYGLTSPKGTVDGVWTARSAIAIAIAPFIPGYICIYICAHMKTDDASSASAMNALFLQFDFRLKGRPKTKQTSCLLVCGSQFGDRKSGMVGGFVFGLFCFQLVVKSQSEAERGPKLTDAADWAPLLSQLKTKKEK